MTFRLLLLLLFFSTAVAIPAHAEEDTSQVRPLYEDAIKAYSAGNHDQAIDIYKQILKIAPRFAPAYTGLGLANKAKGANLQQVAGYFKMAIHCDPKYLMAYDNLGKAYYSMGDLESAQGAFEKALELDDTLTSVQLSMGWIYLLGKSMPEEAIYYFKKAVKSTPLPMAYFGLGLAQVMDNDRSHVLEIITTLKQIGSEPLAKQLEEVMRNNHYVLATPGEPLVNGPFDRKAPPVQPSANFDAISQSAGRIDEDIRVRLRGKLYPDY